MGDGHGSGERPHRVCHATPFSRGIASAFLLGRPCYHAPTLRRFWVWRRDGMRKIWGRKQARVGGYSFFSFFSLSLSFAGIARILLRCLWSTQLGTWRVPEGTVSYLCLLACSGPMHSPESRGTHPPITGDGPIVPCFVTLFGTAGR
ncbi:hypothetical protein GQ53DRAFT_92107 [Thozetella sp. PMI_491]|nr:hypothetical protein GQ53DRAFT_92107 [Thozetella sp. PMI_491]